MTDQTNATGMKRTLGLTGVTVNAMALIAPGAFLWITYQLQAANADIAGNSTALDMWTGIVAALIVAFLTALAFSELAHRYPDAGSGSSYYFAEKAFLDREEPHHRRWARLAKFITGWAAHLFYWVYPGVMVAFMATLIVYIVQQFNGGADVPIIIQIGIAVVFSALVGFIALRGVTGSTNVSIAINVIQLVALVAFSILAIAFRNTNPLNLKPEDWYHPVATSIITPHVFGGLLFQSTIAILILVGFESSTAFGAEAKNPKRDIPRGVILSLVIQGLLAYLFEYFAYLLQYFAANYAISEKLTFTAADGTVLTGMQAAAASGAPIGDLVKLIGDAMLGGNGFALMIIIAITVALAVLGTTLAAMNTAVRISFAMAQDNEMPSLMGALHGKYATPHIGVWILVGVSAVLGAIGVQNVMLLTGITLASNFGTFILYALICGLTFIAFSGREEFHRVRHMIIPFIGLIANVALLIAIAGIGISNGGDSANSTYVALGISGVWAVVSAIYLVVNSRRTGKAIIPSTSAVAAKPASEAIKTA